MSRRALPSLPAFPNENGPQYGSSGAPVTDLNLALEPEAASGAQALERTFLLLREVAARGNRGARLTDLAADTGFNKATVRRLLAAMIRAGLLEQDEDTRRYFLGAETFVLGTIAASRFSHYQLSASNQARLVVHSPAKYAGHTVPLAALLCDRHAETAGGQALALIYESAAGQTTRMTFRDLTENSRRFAGVLSALGVAKGDRVATLLPKGPELLIASIAIWRLGAVQVPLFTTFGQAAVLYRLRHSGTAIVVTNGSCRAKIGREAEAAVQVITVEGDGAAAGARDVPFWSSLHATPPVEAIATLTGEDPFVLLYDAPPTGLPKSIPVPVKALAFIECNMRLVLDVRDDDVFWAAADLSWCVGLYLGLIGSLLLGRPAIFCEGPFDASHFYRVLTKLGITNLIAPPRWYQAMRAAEAELPPPSSLRLRVSSSIGETLPADLVDWVARRLGVQLHDQYGQAELGIPIGHPHPPSLYRPPQPGSIGRTVLGFRATVLDEDGREVAPGTIGELAIDTEKSPLFWFQHYHDDPVRTAQRFRHGPRYYLTGDLVHMSADASFYRLGHDVGAREHPLDRQREVEAAIGAVPAVAGVMIVSRPDRLNGETVKAYVTLKSGEAPSSGLAEAIAQRIKERLATETYTPEVEFVTTLPPMAAHEHGVSEHDVTLEARQFVGQSFSRAALK
jgi:acetyl-CoA synthetase